jgi:hypothetical protein
VSYDKDTDSARKECSNGRPNPPKQGNEHQIQDDVRSDKNGVRAECKIRPVDSIQRVQQLLRVRVDQQSKQQSPEYLCPHSEPFTVYSEQSITDDKPPNESRNEQQTGERYRVLS